MDRIGRCAVGDRVAVAPSDAIGTVVWLRSVRFSGGASAAVKFDDGTWTVVHASRVTRVVDRTDAAQGGSVGPGAGAPPDDATRDHGTS